MVLGGQVVTVGPGGHVHLTCLRWIHTCQRGPTCAAATPPLIIPAAHSLPCPCLQSFEALWQAYPRVVPKFAKQRKSLEMVRACARQGRVVEFTPALRCCTTVVTCTTPGRRVCCEGGEGSHCGAVSTSCPRPVLSQEWADMMKREVERFTARVQVELRGKVTAVAVPSTAETWGSFTDLCARLLLPGTTAVQLGELHYFHTHTHTHTHTQNIVFLPHPHTAPVAGSLFMTVLPVCHVHSLL
jgi:hypothetical protein